MGDYFNFEIKLKFGLKVLRNLRLGIEGLSGLGGRFCKFRKMK